MEENCFDEEVVGEVIIMEEKLKEYYFSLIDNHENDILKTFPLVSLAVYGSIISDPFINVENEDILKIVFNMMSVIKEKINSDVFDRWIEDYKAIINSDKNITDDIIKETSLISEIIFTKSFSGVDQDSYKIYWMFMCIVVCMFPKEIYGLIEAERLTSIRFKTLSEALVFTKKALNLQVALINDMVNYKTKCFKKINTIYSITEETTSSDKWNKDIPNYFAAAIIYTLCRCEYINKNDEIHIGKIIYKNLK